MELDRPRAGSFVATSGEVTCCCVHVYTTTKLKLMYEVCFPTARGEKVTVTRGTEEYQNLHKLMKKDFTNLLPQFLQKFPTKLFGGTQQVEKRVSFLAQFIQFVANNDALISHPHFQNFIQPHNAILRIAVAAGRNLTVRDRNGLSDPFCKVAVYDSKKKAGKGYQTPVIKKTLNPVWKDAEVLVMEIDERADSKGVTVSVWDRNVVTNNAFMGRITIPFTSIPSNTKVKRWFPLHHTKKHTSGDIHGEIKLELYLHSTGPSVSFNEPVDYEAVALKRAQAEERRRRRHKKEQDRNAGRLHLQYLYNPPMGEWEGYLTIKVAGASGLPPPSGQKLPDPYVVLSMGATRERTKVRKNSDNPTWNEIHYFYVPETNDIKSFQIDVYDWNRIEKSIFIGSTSLVLEELVVGPVQDLQVILCGPPHTQKDVSKKLGRRMAEQGYTPNLPIVVVPGFASSGLRVVESSHKPWVNDRVWLSLNKILAQNARKRLDVGRNKKTYDTLDFANKNLWIKHICLSPDCRSDPQHIKVRAIQGKEAVTYLDPGLLTGSLSYVMGPLVENLCELGYNDNNLLCAPYDWRVPFYYLEERDGYFSSLKVSIEAMARREKKKVVLLGHSMGNRVIQYFLNWAKLNHGQAWVDQNIHTFVAVGAPFLGAPKSVRGLVSGDRFGMDLLLSNREAKGFARTLGSVPGLLPIGGKMLDDLNVGVIYTSQGNEPATKADCLPFLQEIGCAKTVELLQNEYRNDPCFGGGHDDQSRWPILGPPPVQRLLAIFGVNLETERLYFYKQGKDARDWVLDNNPNINLKDPIWSQFSIKKGIAYETAETEQPTTEKMTGIRTFCAGDGTVTYASLTYCLMWKNSIKEVIVEELEGVEHREILNNRLFFKKLIEFIGDKPPTISSPVHLTVRGKNYMQKYAKDVLEDVDDDESGADDTSSTSSVRTRADEGEENMYVEDQHDDGTIDDGAYEMI